MPSLLDSSVRLAASATWSAVVTAARAYCRKLAGAEPASAGALEIALAFPPPPPPLPSRFFPDDACCCHCCPCCPAAAAERLPEPEASPALPPPSAAIDPPRASPSTIEALNAFATSTASDSARARAATSSLCEALRARPKARSAAAEGSTKGGGSGVYGADVANTCGRAATPPGWAPSAAASAAFASSTPGIPSSPQLARWRLRSTSVIGPKAMPQQQTSRLRGGGGGRFGKGGFAAGALTIPRTAPEPTRCFLPSKLGHVLCCSSCVLGIPAGAAQPGPSSARRSRVSRSVISCSSAADPDAAPPAHGGSRGTCLASAPADPEGAEGAANGEASSDWPRLRSRLPFAPAPAPAAASATGSISIPAPAAPPSAPGSSLTSRSGPETAPAADPTPVPALSAPVAPPGPRSAAPADAPWTASHPQAGPEHCRPLQPKFNGAPGGRAEARRMRPPGAASGGCGQTRCGHVDVDGVLQRVSFSLCPLGFPQRVFEIQCRRRERGRKILFLHTTFQKRQKRHEKRTSTKSLARKSVAKKSVGSIRAAA